MKTGNIIELVDAYSAAAESYGIAQGNFSQDEKAKAAEDDAITVRRMAVPAPEAGG